MDDMSQSSYLRPITPNGARPVLAASFAVTFLPFLPPLGCVLDSPSPQSNPNSHLSSVKTFDEMNLPAAILRGVADMGLVRSPMTDDD